ncbi:hypothetical protein ENSA5_64450 [Enhygromyxa salina]|uniref:Uncharacterized protein n=1 Tax=Enhygromyxa salina TaxID=215803 RepID=A0A2S9XCK1_9BACT|nr:hypothetical protein [Enhygromyxa salina]PRP90530.1 hypothetical protein ENSA5_64450 [Enhygromyxa salina]
MSDRMRTTALSFAWALVACHRGGQVSTDPVPTPSPLAEAEAAEVATIPITVVFQLEAFTVEDWSFGPGGARLASTEHGDCSVWDVDSGRLIRTFEDEDSGPCEEWPAVVSFHDLQASEQSADKELELDTTKGVAIVDASSGQKLRDLNCPDCASVDDISWSREGHLLALAWRDAARLEVWDADSGTQQRVESIPISGEIDELELGWTAGGATVAWVESSQTECDEEYDYDCERDEATQTYVHRSYDRKILVAAEAGVELSHTGGEGSIADLKFDAEGQWAIWTTSYSVRRMGTRTQLYVAGIAGRKSGLGWTYDEEDYNYSGTAEHEGRWRSDGVTHWAVSSCYYDNIGYISELGWGTFIVEPALGWRPGEVVDDLSYSSEFELELFGFVGDALRFSGEYCGESCTPIGTPPPPNCQLLDVASGHGSELLDCAGAAFLRNTGGLVPLPIDSDTMDWWWSRGGALVLDDGDNFMILDAVTGTGAQPRTDVVSVFDGKLGPELDRVVVVSAGGVELIDLGSGAAILTLAKAQAEQAALSPTGDRLALLDRGQLQVVDVASGEVLARAAVAGEDLAFRQDGDALFVGTGEPEQLVDARTGELLSDELLAKISEARGDLDPSWRWIMDIETDELVRTLDGRELRLAESGSWLPDTGQYSGDAPGSEVTFRVGEDPWALPRYHAEDLAEWLERPDLFEAFVTGEPIPPPNFSAADLARLETKAED